MPMECLSYFNSADCQWVNLLNLPKNPPQQHKIVLRKCESPDQP